MLFSSRVNQRAAHLPPRMSLLEARWLGEAFELGGAPLRIFSGSCGLCERCRALPAKTRGVPTNRGKALRCSQTVLNGRGGEDGERFIRQKARDGAAVLRGREERFLPTRPGAQTTRARKNRAAPLGMTGVVGWCRVPRPHGLRRFASQA